MLCRVASMRSNTLVYCSNFTLNLNKTFAHHWNIVIQYIYIAFWSLKNWYVTENSKLSPVSVFVLSAILWMLMLLRENECDDLKNWLDDETSCEQYNGRWLMLSEGMGKTNKQTKKAEEKFFCKNWQDLFGEVMKVLALGEINSSKSHLPA